MRSLQVEISYESNCISNALSCSLYLGRLIRSNGNLYHRLLDNLHSKYSAEDMQVYLQNQLIIDEASLKSSIRHLRQDVLSRIIVRDINALADLNEVMETTTKLAEICLSTATEFYSVLLSKEFGVPMTSDFDHHSKKQELIIIGMGKLGGCELNVSSDIDLIFAYEDEGETNGPEVISNQEFFTHLVRKVITAIDEVTNDGFVFRVDTRLRPFGTEGVIVSSLNSLENYYQQYGREWERYAWIKGRVILGNEEKLQKLLRPFVFRKYLDFGVISSLRSLKDQIRAEINRKEMHDNIKLGSGGIREIEFIAQVFQLIRGGKDPSLQLRSTLETLDILSFKNIIPFEAIEALKSAYNFLRNLEHRLQYYEDQQTHELPKDENHRKIIAKSMNFSNWSSLETIIAAHRTNVAKQFEIIFFNQNASKIESQTLLALWQSGINSYENQEILTSLGFSNPSETMRKIELFSNSSRVNRLPDSSRNRLNVIIPFIIDSSCKFNNPDETLSRSIELIDKICQRASYLAFFSEFPNALQRIVNLVSASPWLANYISQHPVLLDNLCILEDDTSLDFSYQKFQLLEKLSLFSDDTEQQMNILREEQQKLLFSIACRDILNKIPSDKVSFLLSELANMILDVVLLVVWKGMKTKHIANPNFAIIAYGKFGSKELGYYSDLDLVFLYDDDHIDARDIYSKYGVRIISWLNTFTSSGILYEIDTQLRPDGNSGLLVSSLEGYLNYQLEKAWVWEHQAITRARFAAGNQNVGNSFEEVRRQILSKKRDFSVLKSEISKMRQRMKSVHKHTNGQFDLKQSLGGMIDVEFIAQYLILANSNEYPSLMKHQGTAETILICGELGLIDAELAKQVANSYYRYRKDQHAMRLQGYSSAWVPEEVVKDKVNSVRTLWNNIY
jgi:glutamate-ammonia-ligase adenylyltransferase